MNLALHGLLLQVILSILDIKHGLCSAGEPGYLDFDNLPETNFSCQGKVIGGYYADVEAGCQMFHVCTIGQKDEIMDIKFLCLNGTVFDQETRVCERVDEVDCSKSERFYNLNLELYGNNAVTLSLQEEDNNDEPPILIDNHHQSSSPRPSTTPPPLSQPTTTPPHPSISSTSSPVTYQNSNGYPQHYHPQPPFPSVQTSQSKSRYDDKNGGYHRQYIYHNGDSTLQNPDNNNNNNNNNNDNNQATSYQLFSNHHQGASSTTLTPQQLHHQLSTVSPLYHATSSTLQTLLTGNANNNNNNNNRNNHNNNNNEDHNQQLINVLYNNAIVSTTEQFTIHSNNPRETNDYHNSNENLKSNDDRRILEPIQSTSQGKISKLTISPVPHDSDKIKHIVDNVPPTIRTFYPTPKTPKSQTSTTRVTQHIHLPPPPPIPQLKPHQVTIHLSPPEIQRIVQNPSPLLPSQSRVIVTAKASVSDESGRPLNTTQLVTLPLPTLPASYDDYKEGDESFDPFYRDVPKIRNSRRSDDDVRLVLARPRRKRMARSRRDVDVDNVDVERRIDSRRFEEDEYKEVEEEEKEDYSTALESESSQEQERADSKFDGDYYDDYSNESKSSDANSLGKANVFDGKESQEYDSREYLFYDENEMNSTEHLNAESVTEESETVTENPTTMEIEITSLIDSLNNSEDTVVKFTEEIPGSEEKETSHDVKEQVDNPDGLRDYVDDNYEPQSYREKMMTGRNEENVTQSFGEVEEDLESVTRGDGEGGDEMVVTTTDVSDWIDTTTLSTTTTLTTPSTTTEMTSALTTTELTTTSTTTDLTTSSTITELTTPSTTTEVTTPSTTTELTTTSTTTELTTPSTTTMLMTPSTTTSTNPPMTTTSTTPSTTTTSTTPPPTIASTSAPTTTPSTTSTSTNPSTTARRRYTAATTAAYKPTAPKLKTFPTRKNYIYIPPTTTPLPVVIKTRLPLYNPKPAKPPRSYNELAPRPIIRKRPLLARRVSSTVNDEDLDDTTTVEPITTTTRAPEVLTESVKSTTEKIGILSNKLLEKLSETIGEEIIEQINDLTTPVSVSDVLIETATSHDNSTTSVDSKEDAKAESSTDQRVTEPSVVHSTTTPASLDVVTSSTIASVFPVNRKPVGAYKRVSGFNCLEKEMYRFYADKRDCRLFHYCSPGFTPRQVLDFRFVCEEGTAFDEVTQSCLHDVKNLKCEKKSW